MELKYINKPTKFTMVCCIKTGEDVTHYMYDIPYEFKKGDTVSFYLEDKENIKDNK